MSPDLAARLDLPARWEQLTREPAPAHPRSEAYRRLLAPFWSYVFEIYDPGFTLCPLAFRHPFFDVRLVTYLLAVPPMPWFLNKLLLREAMRESLPEPVRRRRKTTFVAEPVAALLRQPRAQWINDVGAAPELARYVALENIPKVAGLPQQIGPYESDWHLVTRPLLSQFLVSARCLTHPHEKGRNSP